MRDDPPSAPRPPGPPAPDRVGARLPRLPPVTARRFDPWRFLGFVICLAGATVFVLGLWLIAALIGLAEVGR